MNLNLRFKFKLNLTFIYLGNKVKMPHRSPKPNLEHKQIVCIVSDKNSTDVTY